MTLVTHYWQAHSANPVLSTLNRDYWMFYSISQCVSQYSIFTDANGARVPIWPTARQQPGQPKCQQKLLELTMRTKLAAQPALVHKLLWKAVADH
jgi:hypothetical protein